MRHRSSLAWIAYILMTVSTSAADFQCDSHYNNLKMWGLGGVAEEDRDGWSTVCKTVVISGRIVAEDAAKFDAWLEKNPFVKSVALRSPGGDVQAAMRIGRVVRSRFMSTSSERHGVMDRRGKHLDCTREGCCASACVLILAAGASFWPGNIGLHRPSSADFAAQSYTAIKQTLERGLKEIKNYLEEMEISPKLYAAMVEVPSDSLLLLAEDKSFELMTGQAYEPDETWEAFPPSIYEWAKARCAKTGNRESCMSMEASLESIRLIKKRLGITTPDGENVWNRSESEVTGSRPLKSSESSAPRIGPDGRCTDWSHALRHSYMSDCMSRESREPESSTPRIGSDGRCTDWSHALRHSYMSDCMSREPEYSRAEEAEEEAPAPVSLPEPVYQKRPTPALPGADRWQPLSLDYPVEPQTAIPGLLDDEDDETPPWTKREQE